MRPSNKEVSFGDGVVLKEVLILEGHEELSALEWGAKKLAEHDPEQQILYSYLRSGHRDLAPGFNPKEGYMPMERAYNPKLPVYERSRDEFIAAAEATVALGCMRGFLADRKGHKELAAEIRDALLGTIDTEE